MDPNGIAALIASSVTAISAIIGGAITLYRFAKSQAKADLLQDQSSATILQKNIELEELKAERNELKEERDEFKAERDRLQVEVDWLRSPPPRHQQGRS